MYKNNHLGEASCEYTHSFTLCCYYYTCYSPLVMKSICLLPPFVLSPLLSEALIYFLAFQIDYSEPYRREKTKILERQEQKNKGQKQEEKNPSRPWCQVSHICSVSRQRWGGVEKKIQAARTWTGIDCKSQGRRLNFLGKG